MDEQGPDRHEGLLDELPHVEAAQVRRCARVLLRRPLLHINGLDGELLPLMYGHREMLRRLFATYLEYPLRVERRFARLYKTLDGDGRRGVPGFTPRCYAYLALTLAALVEAGRQVLLSQLVAEIRGAAAESTIDVGDDLVELRALAAALRHLVAIGVLEETEGTVGALAHGRSDEALLTVNAELLALVVLRPDTAESNLRTADWQRPEVVGRTIGVQARRRLVEDPVVLYADLPREEADFLRGRHRQEGYWLDRYFGLQVEARAEGMVAIDTEDYLTDLPFPAGSTVARMALLALEPLLAMSARREDDGCYPINLTEIRPVCRDLASRYTSGWAKGDLANLDTLASKVTDLLFQVGIVRRVSGDIAVLVPAAHRWQPQIEEKKATEGPLLDDAGDELTLFDDEDEVP